LVDTSKLLTINNWEGTAGNPGTDDKIVLTAFGSQSALDAFLGTVQFTGFPQGAIRLVSGELVPVPEPGTILAGCLLVGIFGWSERKRLRRLFPVGVRS
jgi:hypothetical protein